MLSTFDFMKESMLTYVHYKLKFKAIIAFYVYVFERMPYAIDAWAISCIWFQWNLQHIPD